MSLVGYAPSEQALGHGEMVSMPSSMDWVGLILVSVVIPAVVAWIVSEFMRKKEIIELGDLKIEV